MLERVLSSWTAKIVAVVLVALLGGVFLNGFGGARHGSEPPDGG